MKKNLTEFFSLPYGLTKIGSFMNYEIFSSDSIKNEMKSVISNNPKLKNVYKSINSMIDRDIIIPGYASPNLLHSLKNIFSNEEGSMIGFYNPNSKNIFIFLDFKTVRKFLLFVNDKIIANIVLHELVHMIFDQNKLLAMKIFDKEFCRYYYYVFNQYFKLGKEVPLNIFRNIIKYRIEGGGDLNLKEYIFKIHKSFKNYTQLPEEEYRKKLSQLLQCMYIGIKNPKELVSRKHEFTDILKPLHDAYKVTFGIENVDSFPFQELFLPEEVICMASETSESNNKISKLLKLLGK